MDKLFMILITTFLTSVGFKCSLCKCKVEKECIKIPVPSKREIWELSIDGGWSYTPQKMEANDICEGDIKETFYKQYGNSESYVAKTQVPRTKMTSCISNVLLSGKRKLYDFMIDKTAKEELTPEEQRSYKKNEVKKSLIEYITNGKKRSFYYDCMPTDPQMRWDQCKCVLYASYPLGKSGMVQKMKTTLE